MRLYSHQGRKEVKMKALGYHLIVECWDCQGELNSCELVKKTLTEATRKAKVTLLELRTHHFNPHGVSGMAIVAESHFSVHTWPEYRYVAVDIFTCGEKTQPGEALSVFREAFKPRKMQVQEIRRGVIL